MKLNPRHVILFGAASLAFSACVLDFGKFEEGETAATTSGPGSGGASSTSSMTTSLSGGGTPTSSSSAGGSPPGCGNMMLDGDESDVDCGGSCDPCANGDDCNTFADCTSQFCNGGGTCAPCGGNGDCMDATGTFCSNGVCIPAGANGSPCNNPGECDSGQCVDGVCCDTACGGLCEACTEAVTGVTDGTCAPVFGNTDPDNECPMATEVCDGASACGTFCGLQPPAPGGMCPAFCNGGCNGNTCLINCDNAGQCQNATLNCPAGFNCDITCNGTSGCRGATINCPDHLACSVTCGNDFACRDANINCSTTGVCDLSCGNDNQVCRDAVLSCGDNACTSTCSSMNNLPTTTCAGSCQCTACM